jgi:hypothetical protein
LLNILRDDFKDGRVGEPVWSTLLSLQWKNADLERQHGLQRG